MTRRQMFEWLQSRMSSLDCNEQIREIDKMREALAHGERGKFDESRGSRRLLTLRSVISPKLPDCHSGNITLRFLAPFPAATAA